MSDRQIKIGDLVRYYPRMARDRKKQRVCVGLIIDHRNDHDWRWPMYLVEWATWPGEPEWYYPHALKIVSVAQEINEISV